MVSFIKRFGALAAGFATASLSPRHRPAPVRPATLRVGATATGVPFTFSTSRAIRSRG